jgi:hypothetical protein
MSAKVIIMFAERQKREIALQSIQVLMRLAEAELLEHRLRGINLGPLFEGLHRVETVNDGPVQLHHLSGNLPAVEPIANRLPCVTPHDLPRTLIQRERVLESRDECTLVFRRNQEPRVGANHLRHSFTGSD